MEDSFWGGKVMTKSLGLMVGAAILLGIPRGVDAGVVRAEVATPGVAAGPVGEVGTIGEAGKAIGGKLKEFESQRKRKQFGPVVVIEIRSELAISATNVLVDSEEKKSLVGGILKAVFPDNMGVSISNRLPPVRGVGPEYPSVQTIDEYIQGILESDRRRREEDPSDPFSPPDPEKLRANILEDLGGNLAVVYRYVGTR